MVILHILLILFHHRDTIREVLLIFLNLFVAQTIIYYVKHKTHVYLTIYLYTCTIIYTVISPDKHTYCTVRELPLCGVWYTYTLYDKMPVLKLCRFRFYVVLSLWIFISKLPIKYHYFMGNSNRFYNTYYQRQNSALIPIPIRTSTILQCDNTFNITSERNRFRKGWQLRQDCGNKLKTRLPIYSAKQIFIWHMQPFFSVTTWPSGTFTVLKTTLSDTCPAGMSEGTMVHWTEQGMYWSWAGRTHHSPR